MVKHKNKDKEGVEVDSDWLHKAKYRDNKHMDYQNIKAVRWEDGSLSWIHEKLLK